MKKILSVILCCLLTLTNTLRAQEYVQFVANNLEGERALVVNLYVSTLLSAFSDAVAKNTLPDVNDREFITVEAWNNILTSWKNNPFTCPDPMVVETAETNPAHPDEYEIRHIPLQLHGLGADSWKNYQEATIRISKSAREKDFKVTAFNLSIDAENYAEVLSSANNVTEFTQLSIILDYLERFRNAYCIKDINFLEQVYSDDALIITGSVIKSKKSEKPAQIKYTKYTKKAYIDHLRTVFARNSHIDVTFDSITVKRHPMIEGLYGVQLFQGYKSTHYSDEGYLFLLWDFRDPEQPQIHIRTWQDARMWEENPNEQRYDLDSFDIDDF